MVLNADTDGDLRAVRAGREDAPGTPAGPASPEDASWADFAGVSSRELGKTAGRLIDALAHRTDETAMKELRRLLDSLQQAVTEVERDRHRRRLSPGRRPDGSGPGPGLGTLVPLRPRQRPLRSRPAGYRPCNRLVLRASSSVTTSAASTSAPVSSEHPGPARRAPRPADDAAADRGARVVGEEVGRGGLRGGATTEARPGPPPSHWRRRGRRRTRRSSPRAPAITPTSGDSAVRARPASMTTTATGTTGRRPKRSANRPATADPTEPRA